MTIVNVPDIIEITKQDTEKAFSLWQKRYYFFFKRSYLKCLSQVICEKYNVEGYVSKPEGYLPFGHLRPHFIRCEYHFVVKIPEVHNIELPKITYKHICKKIVEI
ncbi:hypothetical protein L3V83_12545 [Thiotrichales bacterium 19X7-9]|nr:hypothetical protein [Thiotrichales bacterium 19X7-9]